MEDTKTAVNMQLCKHTCINELLYNDVIHNTNNSITIPVQGPWNFMNQTLIHWCGSERTDLVYLETSNQLIK